MSDETEEQKKLMRQIDISCVQAFHTMDEIDAMVELAKKYRLAAVFTLPAFSAHVAERLQDTREIHAGGVVSFPGGGVWRDDTSGSHLERHPSRGNGAERGNTGILCKCLSDLGRASYPRKHLNCDESRTV